MSESMADEQVTRIRAVDYDLRYYLENNEDIFTLDQIANVHAEVPGHNDEDSWYWVLELTNGQFVLTVAWCDYTGWDCQSGGFSGVADSALAAAELATVTDSEGRSIRRNLVAQIRGSQPFGIELIEQEVDDSHADVR